MNVKNLILSISFLLFLNGCAQTTAMIGPAYTFANSGNIFQAGLTYGGSEAITMATGKTPGENLKEFLKPNKKDTELRKLVKRNIIKTRKKLNINN